jgi:predicted ATP-dependent Lon-type protease
LEAFLKLYVQRAHLKIQLILVGKVPFDYPSSEYENAPLEHLISLFQRHSNNKALVKRLREARNTRNYIAHKIIEDYMDHREKNPKIASGISRKLKRIENDGYDLVEELQKEFRTFYDLDDHVREVLAKGGEV